MYLPHGPIRLVCGVARRLQADGDAVSCAGCDSQCCGAYRGWAGERDEAEIVVQRRGCRPPLREILLQHSCLRNSNDISTRLDIWYVACEVLDAGLNCDRDRGGGYSSDDWWECGHMMALLQ